MSADFSAVLRVIGEGIEKHADQDGLTGVRRAVFLARGGHAPGDPCPTEPAPELPHLYWCLWPEDECQCPAGRVR